MGYGVAFIFIIAFCMCISKYIHRENKTLFGHLIDANNIFCLQYLLASIPFLYLEKYAVHKPVVCILILDVAICSILLYKDKGLKLKSKIKIINRNELIILGLALALVPFISVTSEDIGTVSDQGAYFFHTMVLMEGKESAVHTLDEMGKISKEVDDGLRELQDDLTIYYHYEDQDYYYPHALRTWCSFTALFGRMVGRWDSLRVINYIFVLTIINLFFICGRIALNKYATYLSVGLFALSPLILYIGKAGLTEIIVLFLFIVGLYYMLEYSPICSIFSGICIGLIGFVHVSIYIYMPIITVILFFKSLQQKKYRFINVIQLGLYICSIWYDYRISPIYMEKQYKRFTLGGNIEYIKLFTIISIGVIILIMFQLAINKKAIMHFSKVKNFVYKYFKIITIIMIGIIVARTIYYIYHICFTDIYAIPEGMDAGTWNLRAKYVNKGWISASYLNIVNVARATGIIGLISFFIIPFVKKELSETAKTLYLCTLYALFIFTVFQLDTPSNYYSSRYFIPFLIPLITLVLVSCISNKKWIVCIFLIATLFNCRYWPSFLKGAPQVGQYQMLRETLVSIPNNAIVFCNPKSTFINTRLTSNLRVLNNNEVYNLDNFEEVNTFYNEEDKYIISGELVSISNAELILDNIYPSQFSFGNGKNGSYAADVSTYDNPLFIYKITK